MSQAIAFITPRTSSQNLGDLFVEDSIRRILVYDRQRSVHVDPRHAITPQQIDQINECDAAVIAGTSLWNRSMTADGRWCLSSDDLRQIRVPIVPIGVGTTRRADEDDGFDDVSLKLLRWIHDRCQMAGVSDTRTADVLCEAGILNVSVIGCPTLYRSLQPRWQLRTNDTSRRVAVTVRHRQRRNVQLLIDELLRRGFEPTIAAQQEKDRFMQRRFSLFRPSIPTLYETDLAPYLDLVNECRGVIGWRLEGGLLHLAHGRPAGFFANCPRSAAFCRSFGLPEVAAQHDLRLEARDIVEAVDHWLDPTTYAELPNRYETGFSRLRALLDANGLEHRLGTPEVSVTRAAA